MKNLLAFSITLCFSISTSYGQTEVDSLQNEPQWFLLKQEQGLSFYLTFLNDCPETLIMKVVNESSNELSVGWSLNLDFGEEAFDYLAEPKMIAPGSEIIGTCDNPDNQLAYHLGESANSEEQPAVTLNPTIN